MLAIGNGENCPFCELVVTPELDVVKHLTENHPKEFQQAVFQPSEEPKEDACYNCQGNCHTPLPSNPQETGVIHVRRKIKNKWGTHPICLPCWEKQEGDRQPHYMVDHPKT